MSRERSSSVEGYTITESKVHLKPPKMYKVILYNDDYTTMEFVVHILETVFHKTPSEASQIMLHVHKKGMGICGTYNFEIAETKVGTVHAIAKQYEFPLRCSMEEA